MGAGGRGGDGDRLELHEVGAARISAILMAQGGLNLQPGWAGLDLDLTHPRRRGRRSGSPASASISGAVELVFGGRNRGRSGGEDRALPSPANKAQAVIHDLIRIVSHSF